MISQFEASTFDDFFFGHNSYMYYIFIFRLLFAPTHKRNNNNLLCFKHLKRSYIYLTFKKIKIKRHVGSLQMRLIKGNGFNMAASTPTSRQFSFCFFANRFFVFSFFLQLHLITTSSSLRLKLNLNFGIFDSFIRNNRIKTQINREI